MNEPGPFVHPPEAVSPNVRNQAPPSARCALDGVSLCFGWLGGPGRRLWVSCGVGWVQWPTKRQQRQRTAWRTPPFPHPSRSGLKWRHLGFFGAFSFFHDFWRFFSLNLPRPRCPPVSWVYTPTEYVTGNTNTQSNRQSIVVEAVSGVHKKG